MQDNAKDAGPKPSRRGFFLGVAATGAAVTAVAVLPRVVNAPAAVAEAAPRPAPEKGGGYTLSEHVKRYYRSTSA